MRGSIRLLVPVLVAGLVQVGPSPTVAGNEEALAAYAKLPLAFVPNAGQSDARVRFQAQAGGVSFAFMRSQVVMLFRKGERGHALALRFVGASRGAEIRGERRLPGRVNYLLGSDRTKWRTGLPTCGELVYRELWPGIDLAFRGVDGTLKYEFRVRPGARVEQIRLAYEGAQRLSLTRAGALAIKTPLGVLTDGRPETYQRIEGKQQTVTSRYSLRGSDTYGFVLGRYDPRYPLVIDPGLAYSTFLGGFSDDIGADVAVDPEGNAYVVGYTVSGNFPTTAGAFDTTYNGGVDVFVTRMNTAGDRLVYSTFLGGAGDDYGHAIALDRTGNAYAIGKTASTDFPITAGAFDTTFNGVEDAFVTKLNTDGGALAYSTFVGGSDDDVGRAIAVNGAETYVTGFTLSSDFPTTSGAFDTTYSFQDAFVTKLNSTGSALVYSTFLGAGSPDGGSGITVDRAARAYVTGGTSSVDFPTTAGAFDTTYNNGGDAFMTKLNASGSSLVYSTFLGGAREDRGDAIAIDRMGHAFVTGTTASEDLPTTAGAFDTSHNGRVDAFVTKMNAVGSALAYSTFLGGADFDDGWGLGLDRRGRAFVIGATKSEEFPTTAGAFDTTFNGGEDAFVTKLNRSGSSLRYSTFLGGARDEGTSTEIAIDLDGNAYATGATNSTDFPTTAGAFDATYNGGFSDVFVTKLLL